MKKLTYQHQSEIFEKVVTKNGQLFLVRFVILEREGRLRGKIISCEAIEALPAGATVESEYCLPVFSDIQPAPITRKIFEEIVSPFFTLEFLTSIKIRAPSGY
ncbi:MAG: hypothetical protein UY50_C0025G0008 [Parcubacteria group bacterium GW2011_GWA2_49_9]|nr:MAG: hypothetical protein UY50_C0025G0008 [Parcubacteria group bacterium GW2011_GWA2_49_9]